MRPSHSSRDSGAPSYSSGRSQRPGSRAWRWFARGSSFQLETSSENRNADLPLRVYHPNFLPCHRKPAFDLATGGQKGPTRNQADRSEREERGGERRSDPSCHAVQRRQMNSQPVGQGCPTKDPRRGSSNNRTLFSQHLEAAGRKSRGWQGRAPSETGRILPGLLQLPAEAALLLFSGLQTHGSGVRLCPHEAFFPLRVSVQTLLKRTQVIGVAPPQSSDLICIYDLYKDAVSK